MFSNKILAILVGINIIVTSMLLFKIANVTSQIQEAKDSVHTAIETITSIKTIIAGSLLDKASLVKNGISKIKDSNIVENVKNKLW